MLYTDFSGINRGLKRKVKKAKRDGDEAMLMSIDFMDNISKAFDDLVRYYNAHEKAEGKE